MTETVTAGGQAQADSTGTTAAAPVQAQPSGGQAQTTGNGSGAVAEESFFDPRSIEGKPELQAAYKQMQGEFTRRMQAQRAREADLKLVDQFRQNPLATLQQYANQLGVKLIQGEVEAQNKEFNPQSWDDVKKHFFDQFQKEMLNPLTSEVRDLKRQNIEAQLTSNHPDWRTYEEPMMETLRKHPTLVNDPDTLYRMSVPPSVLEARATKAAMERLKGATENAQISGGTTKQSTTTQPTGKLTFEQAVSAAKAKLASQGMRPPA